MQITTNFKEARACFARCLDLDPLNKEARADFERAEKQYIGIGLEVSFSKYYSLLLSRETTRTSYRRQNRFTWSRQELGSDEDIGSRPDSIHRRGARHVLWRFFLTTLHSPWYLTGS